MNNKKLSNLLLGSALVLGLGASTGSFAQQAQQISESTAALIQETPALKAAAESILGAGTVFSAASAQQIAALSAAMNDSANPTAAKLALDVKKEEINGQPWYMRSSLKARAAWAGFKTSVVAFVAAAGISSAAPQIAGAGLSSPVAKQVLGNSAMECVKEWKDPTATASAALVFTALGESHSVPEFQQKAVEKVRTAEFPTETFAQVKQRLADSMNSEHCDIMRVEGVRPARPL